MVSDGFELRTCPLAEVFRAAAEAAEDPELRQACMEVTEVDLAT